MTKFGRQYPALGVKATNERERLLFFAAAGLAFSLFVIMLAVLFFKSNADARQAEEEIAPAAVPAAVGTITLFAPDRAVRAGSSLNDVNFKELYWPRTSVPDGAIRDIAETRGMFAKIDLQPGNPLLRPQLTREPELAVLPLTPGMRAVSIEVDATQGLEGHALPGTRHDLVLTYRESGELTSKILVQNVKVLSYGGEWTPYNQGGRGPGRMRRTPSRTITLEVSPQDALKVETARGLGRLSLLMRAPEDNVSPQKTRIDEGDISDGRRGNNANRACRTGRARIGGRDYIIGCDGEISEIYDPSEP